MSFLPWSINCLYFFDLPFLIAPLVSSNFFFKKTYTFKIKIIESDINALVSENQCEEIHMEDYHLDRDCEDFDCWLVGFMVLWFYGV